MTNTTKEDELYIKFRIEKDPVAKFDLFIELFCKDNYAHLIDNDDNAGEFMRQAIKQYGLEQRLDEWKQASKHTPTIPIKNDRRGGWYQIDWRYAKDRFTELTALKEQEKE